MSIFKNANESAYVGGRKHWTDVIKNSGSGELLIWRQPEEDFNTNSTLIVMPGEVAIFVKNGVIEQVFENGRYKLDTENYPFISRWKNMFSGGVSTFNCVVYFVRKADSKEIRWGTNSPIQVRDKIFQIRTEARVRGGYKVRIVNPTVFLEKMIGNNVTSQQQAEIENYFASEFQGKIKTVVSKFLNSLERELIGLDEYIDELSENIQPYINEAMNEYGLQCVKFSLSGLDIDTSKYDAIDNSQIEMITTMRRAEADKLAKIKSAEGDRGVMDVLGEDWARQQAANILGTVAANPGAGGAAATGAGIGVGVAAGGVFGSMAQQMFAPMGGTNQSQPTYYQTSSGRFQQQNSAGNTSSNASNAVPHSEDPFEILATAKKMLESGLITQEEYEQKKNEIMSRL